MLVFNRDAAAGKLTYASCVGQAAGCATTSPANTISAPRAIVATNDSVYVVGGDVIDHLRRNTDGSLTFGGCAGSRSGCTAVSPAGAVAGITGLALDPDLSHVYVTAASSPAVSAFARGLHGSIGFQGCIGAASGCTPTSPSDAFAYPGDLVVTPDRKQIEVTSSSIANHGGLSTLARDTATGSLSFLACSGAVTGCQQVSPPDAMEGAAPLALTGDGKLYVGATSTSTIARFSVYSGGSLFSSCTGQTSGCSDPGPAGRPAIPLDVAVLPNGKHVVIADGGSADGGGIRLYRRKELVSCPEPPAATTVSGSAVDVTLTCSDPDGDSVAYVASSAPAHGSVAQPRNGTFTYTPAADYVGDDSFGVFVQEPDGGTTVTVHVSVQAAPPASGSGSHGWFGSRRWPGLGVRRRIGNRFGRRRRVHRAEAAQDVACDREEAAVEGALRHRQGQEEACAQAREADRRRSVAQGGQEAGARHEGQADPRAGEEALVAEVAQPRLGLLGTRALEGDHLRHLLDLLLGALAAQLGADRGLRLGHVMSVHVVPPGSSLRTTQLVLIGLPLQRCRFSTIASGDIVAWASVRVDRLYRWRAGGRPPVLRNLNAAICSLTRYVVGNFGGVEAATRSVYRDLQRAQRKRVSGSP